MITVVWYLIIELAGTAVGNPTARAQMVGPVTQQECEEAKASIGKLPVVMSAQCRRMVGVRSCALDGRPGVSYVCPIFEDDTGFVPSSGGR